MSCRLPLAPCSSTIGTPSCCVPSSRTCNRPPVTSTNRPAGGFCRSIAAVPTAVTSASSAARRTAPRQIIRIMGGNRDTPCYASAATRVSNIPPVDLFGQRLHEVRDLRQMRVDGERLAERFERELVLVEFLHDDAEAGERTEMARLARQHLANVGKRLAVVLVREMDRGAPVPGLDIFGLERDHGVEQLDRERGRSEEHTAELQSH